ncbi:MAG: preprotein translocase subunit SecA [Planctomycetes bacterium]|nr:preprotein translocase subunit SecA [Planctomycetota bacterium]
MIEKFEYLQKIPDSIDWALKKVFKPRNERVLRAIWPIIEQINSFEPSMQALSDEELKGKTESLKAQLDGGKSLEDILPEAFAVVRETSVRVLGMRHYDVQMIGGILLHRGTICEMMTGEGKTLVATCPTYLNALLGKGVHVITVNDYLASRDSQWMGKIHEFLGLSVGCIQSNMEDSAEKRNMYAADVTYGTNNEFGFDYLRDNMKVHVEELVQRPLSYCIIDEVDSILIDEARTPLIISGPAEESDEKYILCNNMAKQLRKEEDFTIDDKETSITLTDQGVKHCEEILGVDNLYSGKHMELPHYINNALRAHHLFKKDKDYVAQGGEVVIVDEHTGRLMTGRRWSDGLHQAVEVKEGLPLKRESQTLASITFQNLFKLYDKISGMTGTAMTESSEFLKIYSLDVVAVPPNRPCQRLDQADLVFGTAKEKYDAIISEIKTRHNNGQPVLVGTATIETSELVGQLLVRENIPHELLNAKQHKREALVVAQAGSVGAVTVATNMAGRGTDIVLGGNIEVVVKTELGPEASEEEIEKQIEERKASYAEAQKKVLELGGLYVLGTERHDARRIDNQLRGRSGRQGDPGESRFYLSLEDDLMRRFAPPWATKWMQRTGLSDGEPIEHSLITKSISNAQKKVEEFNFDIRKNLLEYDEVMNEQRKFIYAIRNRILHNENVNDIIYKWIEDCVDAKVDQLLTDLQIEDDTAKVEKDFREWIERCFIEPLKFEGSFVGTKADAIKKVVIDAFKDIYTKKEGALGEETCRMLERYIMLQTIDHQWKDHLYNMDHVKDSIGWRGYAQVDPKVEYKKEGYRMFADMLYSMKHQVTELAVRMSIANSNEELEVEEVFHEGKAVHRDAGVVSQGDVPQPQAMETDEPPEITKPIVNAERRVGRNDPCPCGSGKKFKQCCGKT